MQWAGGVYFPWANTLGPTPPSGETPPGQTPPNQTPSLGRHLLGRPPQMTIEVGGRHPTGMHFCI